MLYIFDWDEEKEQININKHGVSFLEATTILRDEFMLEIFDEPHSKNEERWICMGISMRLRILVVVYCERDEKIARIISARKATENEEHQYHLRRLL